MAEELFIPKLGQTVEEVTIVDWLVEDGTKVDFGTPLMDVETDKAVFPLESTAKGYLHRGPYVAGQVVPVLTVVGIIGKENEIFSVAGVIPAPAPGPVDEPTALQTPVPTSKLEAPSLVTTGPVVASPRARKLASEKNIDLNRIEPTGYGGIRIVERDVAAYLASVPKATPVAQNIAAQAGLNLASIAGTGVRGAITKADVEQVLKDKSAPADTTDLPTAVAAPTPQASISEGEVVNRIPLKGVRGIIFERMGASVHTSARVTLVMEADATQFVQVREQLKANVSEAWGFTPGYNDILAMIVARCLKEFPYMNARLSKDGTAIEWLSQVNLGMAVDTERGLVVPVIRDASSKGLKTLGSEFRAMVERARVGRSLPDDLSSGTFTITNLGMYDVDAFTPVINLPEVAILGLGRIAPKVVPYQGQPAIRQMWTLSLVFDHRLVDGAPAARFLQKIKETIEKPYLLLG